MHDSLIAVLLGIVEGLTEFLPVSSTAHLLLFQNMLGFQPSGDVFTIVIQFGAILAVVAVYWRKFWDILIGLPRERHAQQFTLGIIVAFLPAGVFGVLLEHFIKHVLFRPEIAPYVIGTTLILGGILILVLERRAPTPRWRDGDRLPLNKCLQIGFCQVLAMVPGVSRSGATILGGELLGVDRQAAAAFTFYLAVPTMLGASVYDLYKNGATLNSSAELQIAIGFVISFVVAFFVVKTFIAFIGRYGLAPFGWYRILAGLVIFGVLIFRHGGF